MPFPLDQRPGPPPVGRQRTAGGAAGVDDAPSTDKVESTPATSPVDVLEAQAGQRRTSVTEVPQRDDAGAFPTSGALDGPSLSPTMSRIQQLTAGRRGDAPEDGLLRCDGPMTVGAAQIVPGPEGLARANVDELASISPATELVVRLAKEHGVTVGFYGGTARDLLLGTAIRRTSDVDLIYDASEPGFDAFRRAVLEANRTSEAPRQIDFSLDLSGERQVRGRNRGLTIEKIGLMANGTMFDFSGRGVDDLSAGVLRYFARPHKPPGIASIVRMAGALVQNEGMRFAPETAAEIQQVMGEFYGPGSPNEAALKRFASNRLVLGPVMAFAGFLKRKLLEGSLGKTPLAGVVERGRNQHWDGRKRRGQNYIDFSMTMKKIVKGGLDSDPARALQILDDTGLVDFLDRIGARHLIADLEQDGRR